MTITTDHTPNQTITTPGKFEGEPHYTPLTEGYRSWTPMDGPAADGDYYEDAEMYWEEVCPVCGEYNSGYTRTEGGTVLLEGRDCGH